ncbi:hypothetical protein [Bacteroides reticulotermitis]|uniref:hypothetical protein n=1 Tax=Bacteroides reticulotermitis TaxID=1133319 RepID=UPI003A8C0139
MTIIDPIVKPTDSKEFLLSHVGQEIKQFELLQRQALMYATSTIVPNAYRGQDKIGNIIIAMDMAKRLNANLLMIMQNLNVIQGNPSWSAKFLISTVNGCGRFNPIEYEWLEGDYIGKIKYNDFVYNQTTGKNTYQEKTFDASNIKNITCTAYTTRKGGEKVLKGSPVDIKTAILEGWYTKRGSKWPTMPSQMLMYRAASWWTNVYAPDLSMGLLSSEEAEDTTRTVVDAEFEELKAEKHIGFDVGGNKSAKKPDAAHDEASSDQQAETPAPQPTEGSGSSAQAAPATNPDDIFK